MPDRDRRQAGVAAVGSTAQVRFLANSGEVQAARRRTRARGAPAVSTGSASSPDSAIGARSEMSGAGHSLPSMKRYVDEDMEGAEFRECNLNNTRLIGVVMQGAVIDGLVTDLVVNGVEVMELRRGRARPSSPGPPTHPLGRPGRPAPRVAAAAHRLGGDRGAHAAVARHRARERERRVVGCADAAPPGLRPRLVVSALLPRVHRSVHSDGPGHRVRARPRGAGPRPVGGPDARRGAGDQGRAGGRARALAGRRHFRAAPGAGTDPRQRHVAAVRTRTIGRGNAWARCSARSSNTISSVCATSTSSRGRSLVDAPPALTRAPRDDRPKGTDQSAIG